LAVSPSWLWSGSNIAWGMDAALYSYKYDSTQQEYTSTFVGWDASTITSHNVSLNLSARPGGLAQPDDQDGRGRDRVGRDEGDDRHLAG